eukprot:TRINITY_DN148_c0_g2_i1.p2 TRINITY_DN148_c0_g2~~TRINITY_DN148_c0_g2_i1.p2  ORF type:complete len:139 (-),score=37.20 TRINITY_DN148_c0_g2_i1:1360-1776(-)
MQRKNLMRKTANGEEVYKYIEMKTKLLAIKDKSSEEYQHADLEVTVFYGKYDNARSDLQTARESKKRKHAENTNSDSGLIYDSPASQRRRLMESWESRINEGIPCIVDKTDSKIWVIKRDDQVVKEIFCRDCYPAYFG